MLFHIAIVAMLAQPEFIVRDLKSRALQLLSSEREVDMPRFEAAIWKAARELPEASCGERTGAGPTTMIVLKPAKAPELAAIVECDVTGIEAAAAQLAIRKAVRRLAADGLRIGITGPRTVAALASLLNPEIQFTTITDARLPDWKTYIEMGGALALPPGELIPGVLRYGPADLMAATTGKASPEDSEKIDPGLLPETTRLTMAAQIARRQRITFETEPGFRVPVDLYRPGVESGDHARGVLFALSDKGRKSLEQDPFLINAHERGWMIFAIDPRGIGELETGVPDFVTTVSTLLGEDFRWWQASDVARIITFAGRASVNQQSGLYAVGERAAEIALRAGYLAGSGHMEWMILRGAAVGLQQREAELIKAQTAERVLFAPMDQPPSFPE